MNTFSQRFAALIDDFPEERESLALLAKLIQSDRHREMTLDHLILTLSPHSVESLVRILERLAHEGAIERSYRVESPKTKAKIEDFTSFEDIPETVYDDKTGTELQVTPRDLRVIYSFA